MNRKYIAMLKHDLILSKKTLLLSGVGYIVCIIVTILLFLSTKYGNLAKGSVYDIGNAVPIVRLSLLIVLVMVAETPLLCFDSKNMISDLNCGWQKFIYTTTATKKEQLYYRYGTKLIGLFLSLIPVALGLGVMVLMSGEGLSEMEWLIMLVLLAYIYVMVMMQMPLNYKFKNYDLAGLSSMLLLMVLIAPVCLKVKDSGAELEALAAQKGGVLEFSDLMDMLSGYLPYVAVGVPVIMIVVTVCSYLFMKKLLEKRVC